MIIAKNTYVTLDYTVFDTQNKLLDSGATPLHYLHGGYGDLFEKIENALEGKSIGESVHLQLLAHESFGEYKEELVLVEQRDAFDDDIEVGQNVEMVFTESDQSDEVMLTYSIVAIEDNKVVLDANHPLAGTTIIFDATVIGLREATPEELDAKKNDYDTILSPSLES